MIHGNRELSDRRQSAAEQIQYYRHQLKLAQAGHTTRRPVEFYERQILFFQEFAR